MSSSARFKRICDGVACVLSVESNTCSLTYSVAGVSHEPSVLLHLGYWDLSELIIFFLF